MNTERSLPVQQDVSALQVLPEDDEIEIDFHDLLMAVMEKIWFIMIFTVLAAVLSGVITRFFITPIYESTAKLYVVDSSDSVINLSDLQIGAQLVVDYQEAFKTWEVNERVIQNLHLDCTIDQLYRNVKITNPSNSHVLYITYQSPDPKLAASIANEYASVARDYIQGVLQIDMPRIMSTALESARPVSPRLASNVLRAALAAFLLSVGFFSVRHLMNDTISTSEDVQHFLNLPVLAVVPYQEDEPAAGARKPGAKAQKGARS